MLIDQSHRRWALATFWAILLTGILYATYRWFDVDAPRGGSLPGLAFGIAAAALILFCSAFPLRKKVPTLPLGSAQAWLRAHIWLGLLTLPLTLFHTGSRLGGWLEHWLMLTYGAVMVSGVIGMAFQHYMPRYLKTALPSATMFEQIPYVLERLRKTADELINSVAGSLFATEPPTSEAAGVLRQFYLESVRPYLAAGLAEKVPLGRRGYAAALFARVRLALPPEGEIAESAALHNVLRQLEAICEERRTLERQRRLHQWLHGWLLVHLPLSIGLLTLLLIHALSAIYY